MKLSSIFQLYKTYYPTAVADSVTLSSTGSLLRLSDRRRSFRLNAFSLHPDTANQSPASLERTALAREFVSDNRREFFLLQQTRCLYGVVYAENLSSDLRLLALHHGGQDAQTAGCDRLRLTYLFALADRLSRSRYSLSSLTLNRSGVACVVAEGSKGHVAARVEAGGRVRKYAASGRMHVVDDEMTVRYARLFWRDNAEWFANFAAGREDLL